MLDVLSTIKSKDLWWRTELQYGKIINLISNQRNVKQNNVVKKKKMPST